MKQVAGDKVERARRSRWVTLAGIAVGLFVFALYLATLAPTILYYTDQMKDSAVLPTIAYTLGISHPTGYPTYTLLTYLFTFLPVGDVAYRVNLSSAVCGSLAVGLLYAAGLRVSKSLVAAAAGALAFGTSALYWSQAVIAEVYTLHILFLALSIFVLFLWRDRREDKYLLLAAFTMGLCMTHNLTSGLLLPAALLFVLLVEPRKLLEWKLMLGGTGLCALALLSYAYLPIRANMDPALNVEDPSNWQRFEDMLTGGEFKERMWAFGPEELPDRFFAYLDHLSGQFHPAFVMMAIVGLAYLFFRDRAAAVLLGFLYLGLLFYALEYDVEDVHYYYIPTYAILAVCASAGLGAFLRGAETATERFGPEAPAAVAVVLALLAFAVPLWSIRDTYREVDMSEEYWGRAIVEAVASETAPNAIVIQHRSPLSYMTLVEGRRRDIELWNVRQPDDPAEVTESKIAIREGRLYILFPNKSRKRAFEEAGYELVPVEEGMLYKVDRGG